MGKSQSEHASAAHATSLASSQRKNLVLFMPDQLRYDALGVNGNSAAKTPNIDAFAERGTRFTNCYVQNSVCTQSRCSMFTGLYPHVSGHRSLDNLLKPWEDNMFKSLKEHGYHIACLGPRGDTWAPGVTEVSVNEYGFLEMPPITFVGAEGGPPKARPIKDDIHSRLFYKGKRNGQYDGPPEGNDSYDYDEAVIRSAETWLRSSPPQPFVLFMPLIFPHVPFVVEEPFYSMHDRDSMPPRIPAETRFGYEPKYMQAIRASHGLQRCTDELWREVAATYYGMVSRIDHQFGRILKAVEDNGFKDSSYIFHFTDHGEYLGDYGLVEKWPSGLSDCLTRQSLIIAGPDLPEGQTNSSMCEMVDLVPTVFELLGIPEHFPHNGRSLVDVIRQSLQYHKDFAFSEGGFLLEEEPLLEKAGFPYDLKANLQHEDTALVGKSVACRSQEWTYIYRLYEQPELYSRKKDPQESRNLAGLAEYSTIEQQLKEVVFRWLLEASAKLPFKGDPRFPKVQLDSPKEQWAKRVAEVPLR